MDKIKTFLHDKKAWIVGVISFVVGGLAATGHVVPQGIVDFLNSVVNSF